MMVVRGVRLERLSGGQVSAASTDLHGLISALRRPGFAKAFDKSGFQLLWHKLRRAKDFCTRRFQVSEQVAETLRLGQARYNPSQSFRRVHSRILILVAAL